VDLLHCIISRILGENQPEILSVEIQSKENSANRITAEKSLSAMIAKTFRLAGLWSATLAYSCQFDDF
jgi:hypothetical protein